MQLFDWAQERYLERMMSMKEEKPKQSDDGALDKSSGEFLSRSRGWTSPPCEDIDIADAFSKAAIKK
jgi:hypothetical protein